MPAPQHLAWIEPLDLAAQIDEAYWVLLYSGEQTTYSGRYSFLAHRLKERVQGDRFSLLENALSGNSETFEHAWFGYFGYELKDTLEDFAPQAPNPIAMPPLCMMRFESVYRFDHERREIALWSPHPPLPFVSPAPPTGGVEVAALHSSLSRRDYLRKCAAIIDAIHRGDLYQANLTRKYHGHLRHAAPPFPLFRRFCEQSPAPYSAFLKMGDTAVLSSSPELFVQIGQDGGMRARPIKGTAPRFPDPREDKRSLKRLTRSAKDRAENLMIVDLMRNDFARSAVSGSIRVPALFEVTSHTGVHHLSSTITARKASGQSSISAIRHCFPPGSMTGAPKIRAIQLCGELEGMQRGIYSGALGWLGSDGSCELSVVIRTLVLRGDGFEFQVGGGIIADSTPEQELNELLDKARGISGLLGLSRSDLEHAAPA